MSLRPCLFLLTACLTAAASLPAPTSPQRGGRIRVVQHLELGDLLVEEQGGSFALTERNEIQTYSWNVRPAYRSTTQEARIALSGPPRTPFSLTLDPDQPILENGRGQAIRLAAFILPPEGLKGTFNDQGEAEVRLGAKLDIPAGTPAGRYAALHTRIRLSVGGALPEIVTERLTVQCTLQPVIHLTNRTPLDFGTIIPGEVRGDVRVHPDGHISISPGSGIRPYRSAPSPAEFLVTGTVGTDYCLELPKKIILKGPGQDMEVHRFEANTPLPGVMPRGGFTFRVGASLSVPPDQAPGQYKGVFVVTINYD